MGVAYCFYKNFKNISPENIVRITPLLGGWGDTLFFGAYPVGAGVGISVHFFIYLRYLLNQILDFDQICIYTMLGGEKELI